MADGILWLVDEVAAAAKESRRLVRAIEVEANEAVADDEGVC